MTNPDLEICATQWLVRNMPDALGAMRIADTQRVKASLAELLNAARTEGLEAGRRELRELRRDVEHGKVR